MPQKRIIKSKQSEHWQTLNRSLVYSGNPWIQVFREQVKLPDGKDPGDITKEEAERALR